MSISKQLKTLRESSSLSQKKVAEELGITQGAYSLKTVKTRSPQSTF